MAVKRREASDAEVRALAHPVRLRILRLVRFEELTNAEIAARLELNPATTLHHVRILLKAGFIEETATRLGPNGITEKPYRDTKKSWTLNVGDATPMDKINAAGIDAFLAEVNETGAKIETLTRTSFNLDQNSIDELQTRLLALYDEYEKRSVAAGTPYALFSVIHRRPRQRRGPAERK